MNGLGKEDQLSLAFATELISSKRFLMWVLSRTKFSTLIGQPKILHEEQLAARTSKFWWRHWWADVPDYGESETDILVAFETETGTRFCVHFENKLSKSKFTPGQELAYDARATYMLNSTNFAKLRCTDFDCALVAPLEFVRKHQRRCQKFRNFLAHEEVSKYLPQFTVA